MALEAVRSWVYCLKVCSLTVSCTKGDMVEYNQCQGMLRHLYDLGLPGNFHEFLAYRILSMVHGRNKSGMFYSDLKGRWPVVTLIVLRRNEFTSRSTNE